MNHLPMPTPDELEAEALELERRAHLKERLLSRLSPYATDSGRRALRRDIEILNDEAASKRAKAERMRKAVTT